MRHGGPIAYTLVRVVIGFMLFMHVSGKIQSRARCGRSQHYGEERPRPSLAFAYAAIILETVGGVCLIIGLFTRFFAAALAIEMAIAFLFVAHCRRAIAVGDGGYEYVLLLGVVLFAIAIRGGGPYSVDRMIGKEL